MSERQAIVTLAIGGEYSSRWRRFCESNWRRYAARHGYELICIDEPLDHSERARQRSPAWQKLLVLGQPFAADYERIVWVDADVVFGHEAPSITADVPPELVGAVDELELPTAALRQHIHPYPMEEYYAAAGLDASFEHIVQSGVMVVSPRHHRELFEHVYHSYEDLGPGLFYEMRPLSYELLRNEMVSWLDPRFNVIWGAYRMHRFPFLQQHPLHPRAFDAAAHALEEVYALHFAGSAAEMEAALNTREPAPSRPITGSPTKPRQVRTPVALIVYKRPDTTSRVLDAVRQVRPERLFVVANAPRDSVPGEAEQCEQTLNLLETIDWDCDVSTDLAERHLPQKLRIESGIDWVFSEVEEAVILEDDCVPDPTFFAFCDELLDRYRDDERVMSITGNNFQFDEPASSDGYYFSRYPFIWGWATWRRAWEHYDPEAAAWPQLRESDWLNRLFGDPNAAAYWWQILDENYRDREQWDFDWFLACWQREGLHVTPNVNLVTNVGFRADATHTRPEQGAILADLPLQPISFPLRHPAEVARDVNADDFTERVIFSGVVKEIFDRLRRARRQRMIST